MKERINMFVYISICISTQVLPRMLVAKAVSPWLQCCTLNCTMGRVRLQNIREAERRVKQFNLESSAVLIAAERL